VYPRRIAWIRGVSPDCNDANEPRAMGWETHRILLVDATSVSVEKLL
jgi:hypothetical protein